MDVVFYDFDFGCRGIFPRPVSVNIEKKYCGYGNAELHFAIDETEVIELLDSCEYLFFAADGHTAIVTGWQIGEDIAVYGRTPEWLLTKRGIKAFERSSETAEDIARYAVGSAEDFVALGSRAAVGSAMEFSTEGVRSIYDVVCEVLSTQKLGFEVCPDVNAGRFVFRVYEGELSLCLLSASNRTAYDMKYSVERQDAVTNSGWYERRYKDMDGWDAGTNTPQLSNNQPANAYSFYKVTSEDAVSRFGLTIRKNTYLYCDNPQGTWKLCETKPDTIWLYISDTVNTGLRRWDAVLEGVKSEDEAKAEFAQRTVHQDIDCEADRYEYNVDYRLGDVVRVQLELGNFKKTESRRVTSVNVYYDVDASGVIPILTEE